VVDKVALGQIFSEYFGFPCQFSFHRLLHTHHLSSGAGTIGHLLAHEPSGLSLTPTQALLGIVGGGVQLSPLGIAATNRPTVPVPGDYDDGEIGGMIGRGNRSTRRKPAPMPLCLQQTPHTARTRTRAAAVGSQLLTAWVTARPPPQETKKKLMVL
jgi:hypothetical protein